ncbi:MAG: PAS domain-containing protein, partial [Gammaproteobacteria bacterium]|nr:PAS domain-containing protein [Gammaproteobacteria bacterium]
MGRTTTLRGGLGGKSATAAEQAWVEVIEKMDETYAELVRYEVELEDKNATLEETQGFLASVLASMSDVLVVCDHNGLVQQVNESLEAIVGVKASELAGRPLPSLFVADQRDM